MSGHNKWSTIKRKKGANDAARAKVFTKIGRELAVAVKNGGPDPNNNAKIQRITVSFVMLLQRQSKTTFLTITLTEC